MTQKQILMFFKSFFFSNLNDPLLGKFLHLTAKFIFKSINFNVSNNSEFEILAKLKF